MNPVALAGPAIGPIGSLNLMEQPKSPSFNTCLEIKKNITNFLVNRVCPTLISSIFFETCFAYEIKKYFCLRDNRDFRIFF